MGLSGEYHICIFYTSLNQLEFGVEMFPKVCQMMKQEDVGYSEHRNHVPTKFL